LFVQVWCHETVLVAGQTLTFHQEGSDLTDSTRSLLKTPMFLPDTYAERATIRVTGQTGILATSHCEAFWMSNDSTAGATANDHQQAAALCPLSCENVVAADGFDIVATPIAGVMSGTWGIRWVWN
jgi:hypothetical protein